MKRPRLLLINPVDKFSAGFSNGAMTCYPPLGLLYVAALTPRNWDIELIDENFEEFKFRNADLVGISSMTPSINRAYEIAGIYKKRGIPVVLGGVHVSMLPAEALNYGDTVVIGEVESIWKVVLDDYLKGYLLKIYYGEKRDLDNLVEPRRDMLSNNYNIATIQTSRGCPMNCEFCSVTSFNGGWFRQRPVEAVLDELEGISQRLLFFVDDNLLGHGGGSKDRALKLFDGMIKRGIKKYWWAQSSFNIADDEEVLKWAARSGCKALFIGIESVNTETLRLMNKGINLKIGVDNYKSLFRKFHKYGIAVWGGILLGNDTDGQEIFKETAEFIIDSGLDIAQITFATPLPGTRFYDRLSRENRIIFRNYPEDWRHYFFQKLVYETKRLSVEENYRGMRYVKEKVYSPFMLKRKFFRTFFQTRKLTSSILAYKINKVYQQLFYSYDYYKNY
ncbi:MAG: radical SAM protein [Candidatus Omnitrophica bacterium]|nr:radical SAM protein [Candidatus Omnitrophota bacterium]